MCHTHADSQNVADYELADTAMEDAPAADQAADIAKDITPATNDVKPQTGGGGGKKKNKKNKK